MSRVFALFTIASLILGCSGAPSVALRPIPSPSRTYTVTPSINTSTKDRTRYLCVAFDVTDNSGATVGHVQTGASDGMRWALGWHDDGTIVLYSSDIGTYAWKLDANGRLSEAALPISDELRMTGKQLVLQKYQQRK